MTVDVTLRAKLAIQEADDRLRTRLMEIIDILRSGGQVSPKYLVKKSASRPNVFVVKVDSEYRLFYTRKANVISVLDVVPRSEAYQ